jgi:hypothetical protein
MLRYAADENFNNDIMRGLLRRQPALDVIRVQDSEANGADDPRVLEWAAAQQRIVLTHDVSTMTAHAHARVAARLPMPGLVEVSRRIPIGRAIDDLLLIAECSLPGEWDGQVIYLLL